MEPAVTRSQDLLRVLTCGSVDDGKSTLIGRLLHDCGQVFDDELQAVANESRAAANGGGGVAYALLLDGLEAEREQGITIDVAYRFFESAVRRFIVADAPGHEQYTRNMVTGASTADAAIVLADARKGVVSQTRRHGYIIRLLGVRHTILAVNKMDLVDHDQAVFRRIAEDWENYCGAIGLERSTAIPICAVSGSNVVNRGEDTPWYDGATLMEVLDSLCTLRTELPFRMSVQRVSRSCDGFRGYAGTIVSGRVTRGSGVRVYPSSADCDVSRIVTFDGDLEEAAAGQAVTLVMSKEIDAGRGDLIAANGDGAEPHQADQFAAQLIWLHRESLLPGRSYIAKIGTKVVNGRVTDLRYAINTDTMEHVAAKTLKINEIGICNVALDQIVAFDSYDANRGTGSFILIDRFTNETVGAGLIQFPLRRAANLVPHEMSVTRSQRADQKFQKPCILWMTGLSGSGKSTLANRIETRLALRGKHSYLLDGDNVRLGLNKDLGFTDADRVENIRRVAEVAKLFVDAGMIVLVAFISPFREERQMARELVGEGEFIEIFVDAPQEVCEQRDPKGLYQKARAGEIRNFTGIDSVYEPPEEPEMVVKTAESGPDDLAIRVVAFLDERGYL